MPDGYRASGDLVRQTGDGSLYFQARKSYAVKLPNGRWLHPEALESELRERHGFAGHCVLISNPESARLRLICSEPSAHAALGQALSAGRLGTPVDAFVESVELIAADELPLLPKGDVQRARLQRQVFRVAVDANDDES